MAAVDVAPVAIAVRRTRLRIDWRILTGATGLGLFVMAAVIAPLIAPYAPNVLNIGVRLQGPSATHLLGTDELGRDILSRLLYGLRPSLVASLAAISLAGIGGVLLGLPAGYFGSWFDELATRVFDLLIAWPAVFLAIAIVLLFGSGEWEIILAIGFAELPIFARLVRSIAIVNAGSEHVEAARASGASHRRIMRVHILPFVVVPLAVQFAIAAPQALVAEASLNYLGLGTRPPSPSLGAMVSEGQNYLAYSSGAVVFPVIVIVVLVVCLTLLADGLQDRLDPHRHGLLQ